MAFYSIAMGRKGLVGITLAYAAFCEADVTLYGQLGVLGNYFQRWKSSCYFHSSINSRQNYIDETDTTTIMANTLKPTQHIYKFKYKYQILRHFKFNFLFLCEASVIHIFVQRVRIKSTLPQTSTNGFSYLQSVRNVSTRTCLFHSLL